MVSELLFSAGVGCCFTQPRTPRFHHVRCLAIGHRIIFGPKALYLNSKTQNPSSGQMMTIGCPVSDYTYLWTDDDPVIKGPSRLCPPWQPPTWHFELCSCRLYISPSSPMRTVTSFKHSTLLLCTCHPPRDDGVAKIISSQSGTSSSSSWSSKGTHPSTHVYFNAFIIVSNVANRNQRPNAQLDTTKASKTSMMTQRPLLKIDMPLPP